jgi:hypothetical protein
MELHGYIIQVFTYKVLVVSCYMPAVPGKDFSTGICFRSKMLIGPNIVAFRNSTVLSFDINWLVNEYMVWFLSNSYNITFRLAIKSSRLSLPGFSCTNLET